MNKRAFTLVELVIVLVILAILVGVALPAFTGARAKAYRAEALPIMNEIKAMAWCYRLQYGNDTNPAWTTLPGVPGGPGEPTKQILKALGYSESDIPQTNNFNFTIYVHGKIFYDGLELGFSTPGECGGLGCFGIEAIPRPGSSAQRAGSPRIWLVMNQTSATIVGSTTPPP